MKKQYESAKIELLYIEANDIIATSSPFVSSPFDSEEQPLRDYGIPDIKDH